jgi:dTDP-4-amino-4,6-dideoxygalactose transaminase
VCPQLKELLDICRDRRLFLIEDAAQAHGASIDGRKAGSLADAGSFSFFPTKVMTTGEGGMITTNDRKLALFSKSLRYHGMGRDNNNFVRLGYNWRMNEISAIIGISQLKRLDRFLTARNKIAERYSKSFTKIEGVKPFSVPPNIKHSYFKYPVLLEKGISRLRLAQRLKAKHNIETGVVHYPPCHLQPVYLKRGYKRGMLPIAENVLSRTIALPIFAQMTTAEAGYVIDALTKEVSLHTKRTSQK